MSYHKRERAGYGPAGARPGKRRTMTRSVAKAKLRSAGRVTRARAATANTRTGGFLGIEFKFYDTSLVGSAIAAPADASGGEKDQSATIGPTTITQGDGEQQRDGRKCSVRSVFVNGVVTIAAQLNQTAADVASTIYVALVKDTQTNGALLNSEDVYKNISADALTAASPVRNLLNNTRFMVLDRTQFTMDQPEMVWDGTNIEQGGMSRPFTLSWKGVMNQLYNGTTETIANVTDNSIHVIAYCNSTTAAPLLSYNCRARFVG